VGEVWVAIEVRGLGQNGGAPQKISALADTGAVLTLLPADLLREAGVRPEERIQVGLADGSVMDREVGDARITVEGKSTACRVIFGAEKDEPLIGVTVLEQVGFMVDPVQRRLVPTQIKIR